MKSTEEMIEVMNAYVNGKEIEFLDEFEEWFPANTPCWNWNKYDYRVKPEPTRLEVANKFWKDTFGIENNFNEDSCAARLCQNCPLNRVRSCTEAIRKIWWNAPMESKDGDKDA